MSLLKIFELQTEVEICIKIWLLPAITKYKSLCSLTAKLSFTRKVSGNSTALYYVRNRTRSIFFSTRKIGALVKYSD